MEDKKALIKQMYIVKRNEIVTRYYNHHQDCALKVFFNSKTVKS